MKALKLTEPITLKESSRLVALEAVIAQGKQTFWTVATALAEVKRDRLYRSDYGTFEDYCRLKWGWSASRARQIIGAVEVAESVTNVTLSNEAQARALADVPADERNDVVKEASKGGKLTAASIRKVKQAKAERLPEAEAESDARPHIQTATEILQSHPADVKEIIRSKVACIQADCGLILRGVDKDQIADLGPLANELIELAKAIRALANTHLE